MILVDTSVWVEHLRRGESRLVAALEESAVVCHPMIQGELACGTLRNRGEVLDLLGRLPRVPVATDEEAMALIERRALMGRGIGWVDVHLLASTLLLEDGRIWTRDRRLSAAAEQLGIGA